MENKDKVDFKIGDLVKLKSNFTARLAHPYDTPQKLGLGIIIEKLTELHTLSDRDNPIFEYEIETDYISIAKKKVRVMKHTIQTKICKVYWLNLKAPKWEYEDDIEIVENETPDYKNLPFQK